MESISNSMRGLCIFSAIVAAILLVVGITMLVIVQKKVHERNKMKEAGESIDLCISESKERTLTPISCFLIEIGIVFCVIAVKNTQFNNLHVETTTVVATDWSMSKGSKGKTKTRYYATFSNGMEKKITEGTYRKMEEGDVYYLVLNNKNKILDMYSGKKYVYEE